MAACFPLVPGGSAGRDIVAGQVAWPGANAGLVWQRYLPLWQDDPSRPERERQRAPLDRFLDRYQAAGRTLDEVLSDRVRRRADALERLARRRRRVLRVPEFEVAWRFAAGLGGSHPTGNGFSFEVPGGHPCLPGAAVKGLCRRAAALQGWSDAQVEELFGPKEIMGRQNGIRDALAFFDALPRRWPRLCVDIVNCHHPDYYRTAAESLDRKRTRNGVAPPPYPHETEGPNPVYFLAVDKGARFSFAITAPTASAADAAEELLALGLDWLGIGAKTAVGYGVFKRVPSG